MPEFRKPSPKPRDEPPGLDAFAAGAAVTPVLRVVERVETAPPADAESRPRTYGMNVKFSAAAKAALERLAASEQRSQQMILTRLFEPLLIAAAERLPPPPKAGSD